MRLILDTHILLWWAAADRRLTKSIRDVITAEDNDIAVSAATFWELAIKKSLGRIDVDLDELHRAATADGFQEMPVIIDHAVRLQGLPELHRDPFDRMLIVQAIAEERRLLTRDEAILAYRGVSGFDPLEA